jgi:hypothetical protein
MRLVLGGKVGLRVLLYRVLRLVHGSPFLTFLARSRRYIPRGSRFSV